ncbi:MAG: MFS transporter, partial [Woeseia sp.]|nr:MFS transporter [Woeseia sp.]
MSDGNATSSATQSVYGLLTGDEDARVCTEIPDDACREQPRNYLLHIISLTGTSIGDSLASPKLVLAWLLTNVGAPQFMLGLLVPIRESLSLLPQLFIAKWIREVPIRKWFWVAGSIAQGFCVAAMAVAVLNLTGAAAGWAILGLLVIFSLSRGVCSVASKDVLGKTIAKTRRGSVSGYAASAAGAVVVAVGIVGFLPGAGERGMTFYVVLLVSAAVLWVVSALTYSLLKEYRGATEGGGNAIREAIEQFSVIRDDAELRHFIIVRTLLISTALVAPFYVSLMSSASGEALSGLGALMIASGAASFVSAPIWGHLADRSSRQVMMAAAGLAGVTGIATALIAWLADESLGVWWFPAAYFLLSIAHAGVRLGRKTHLVDIATADNRATYVAVSNTIIGVMLLVGGAFAGAAASFGPAGAIFILA